MFHAKIPLQKTIALILLKILWKANFIKIAGFKFAILRKDTVKAYFCYRHTSS